VFSVVYPERNYITFLTLGSYRHGVLVLLLLLLLLLLQSLKILMFLKEY
jgi:hypothetical protein